MRLAKRALDLPLPLPLLLVAAITLTAAVPLLSPARAAGLIAPVPVEADEQEIEVPKEVMGWFYAAIEAGGKGDLAEALRLQRQVMGWVEANLAPQHSLRARSLINLGRWLNQSGRHQEALAAVLKAERILRDVLSRNPAYRLVLVTALHNLAEIYNNLGRPQVAAATNGEAVQILRELVKTNPDLLPYLALSLRNLSRLHASGPQALAPSLEAVRILRELRKVDPETQAGLALELTRVGVLYGELGRDAEALPPSGSGRRANRP
jgi:tetratricopeptide (TPR) repeat protein